MKIIVKDYYAIKRAKARASKLSVKRRKEIARNAVMKRWNNEKSKKIQL